tara:strand:+ start:22246 stop:22812 length:567 start_codon:yes stop_codon:yes gene_type:complete
MTTRFNRIPKMILAIAALTVGTAGVAVASPGQGSSRAKRAKPTVVVAQGGQAKLNRKANHKAARQANQPTRKAKRLAKFDSNRNGKIEPAERQAVRQQRFASLDANRDGALTLREMQTAKTKRQSAKNSQRRAKLSPQQQAKRSARQAKRPDVSERFAKLDANRNGSVSRGEYVQRPGNAKRRGKGNR